MPIYCDTEINYDVNNRRAGNLYIKFNIEFPKKITEESKAILRKILPD